MIDNLASNIKILREEARLTVEEFASKAGVDVDTVIKWENGTLRPLTRELMVICPILHIHEEDILERDIVKERNEAGEKLKKSKDRSNYDWYYGSRKLNIIHLCYLIGLPLIGLLTFLVYKYLLGYDEIIKELVSQGEVIPFYLKYYYVYYPFMVCGFCNLVYMIVNLFLHGYLHFRWWYLFFISLIIAVLQFISPIILIPSYIYILYLTIFKRKKAN